MTLAAGTTLSFYEILGPLGAGGMGEVYRARDTRLDRDVAIKVLPDSFAGDEERLRRFEREAKVLASLNHPNVAAIYGVDQVDDVCFLALEHVPGEDLAARLANGPLSIEESIDAARQIAEGLEAAHDAGVVHRDLKPANVRVTPDAIVKVLDFGLAKTQQTTSGTSSTDSALHTEAGTMLGTPTYMAPEQARGRPIDRRVDLWALGCVLFECLTGKRPFDGPTLPDVLNAVLEHEPDLNSLPSRTPTRVRELIERCLAKDPRKRTRDAGDARLELERALEERAWTSGARATEGGTRRTSKGLLAIGIVGGIALGAVLARGLSPRTDTAERELRLSIDMRVPYQETYPRISPDGMTVVHEGLVPGVDGKPATRALFRRDLDDFESAVLVGTESPVTFCFSPDGCEIAALVELSGRGGEQTLVRASLGTGTPTVRIGTWPRRQGSWGGIAWLTSRVVVGVVEPNQLAIFPVDGGSPTLRPIERAFERPGNGVSLFRALGDGRHALGHTFYYDDRGYVAAVVAVDIETGEEKILARDAEYGAVTAGGSILFSRRDVLFRAEFDAEQMRIDGPAVPIADGLRTANAWRAGWFDVASNGTLIWLPGGRQGQRVYMSIVERDGTVTPFWSDRMMHDGTLSAAPDGSFISTLVVSNDGQRVELWGSKIDEPHVRRLLAAPGVDFVNGQPLPGGKALVFQRISKNGERDGIYRAELDAPADAELLAPADPSGPDLQPVGVAPDGTWMIVELETDEGVQYSTLSTNGPASIEPLFLAKREYFWPRLSDDGRWIAIVSEETDRTELFVQRIDERKLAGPRRHVPTPDGSVPWDFCWSRDPATDALGFLMIAADRRSVFSVTLEDEEAGRFAAPKLTATVGDAYVMDVAPLAQGRMMVLLQDPEAQEMDRINVVIGGLSPGD